MSVTTSDERWATCPSEVSVPYGEYQALFGVASRGMQLVDSPDSDTCFEDLVHAVDEYRAVKLQQMVAEGKARTDRLLSTITGGAA